MQNGDVNFHAPTYTYGLCVFVTMLLLWFKIIRCIVLLVHDQSLGALMESCEVHLDVLPAPLITLSSFEEAQFHLLQVFVMLIGDQTLMIISLQQDTVFILVQVQVFYLFTNKKQCLKALSRQSIEAQLLSWQNSYGCPFFYLSYVYHLIL